MQDLQFLKEVLSVPTKTYQEERMVQYIVDWLRNEKIEHYVDEHMNVYAIKQQKESQTDFYFPCVVAHTDTVHNIENINIREEMKPNTLGELKLSLKAYNDEGKPTGIGGDDKCGVFACLKLLKQLPYLKAAFFVSEETGCHGSSNCDETFLKDVGYITQYDAPGNHLITEICSGVRLFERESEFFQKTLPLIENGFGGEVFVQSHPYTDISQLKKKSDVCCINMSCGYYNMHTAQEFVSIEDVEKAIEIGKNMVLSLGLKKYKYEYKPMVYNPQTVMNSLLQYQEEEEYDLEEETYQLQTMDVVEDKDGLYLVDSIDGVPFFISDEDLPDLYEIIKNRLLSM